MKNLDEDRFAKALGSAMGARRSASGLSQEELAELLSIGSEAVSRMERGVVVPSLRRLVHFADVVGCGVDELLLGSSSRPHDQARWLAEQLEKLSAGDRDFLLALIEQLCSRLDPKFSENSRWSSRAAALPSQNQL